MINSTKPGICIHLNNKVFLLLIPETWLFNLLPLFCKNNDITPPALCTLSHAHLSRGVESGKEGFEYKDLSHSSDGVCTVLFLFF
jgi:hypothetical protein